MNRFFLPNSFLLSLFYLFFHFRCFMRPVANLSRKENPCCTIALQSDLEPIGIYQVCRCFNRTVSGNNDTTVQKERFLIILGICKRYRSNNSNTKITFSFIGAKGEQNSNRKIVSVCNCELQAGTTDHAYITSIKVMMVVVIMRLPKTTTETSISLHQYEVKRKWKPGEM